MLVTNYGVDCAFAQVIYYHITGNMDFATISPRNINVFFVSSEPDILVGYSHIGVPIPKDVIIISNTKSSESFFSGFKNFIYKEKTSNTRLLYEYLSKCNTIDDKTDKIVLPLCNIADNIFSYNENSINIKELYDIMGHYQFVYRFIINPDLVLNKHEQQLIARSIKEKELIVNQYCNNFLTYDDGIVVCRSYYNINDMLVSSILSKYETEVVLIALWDYTQDGNIKINLYSQSKLASKLADKLNGNGYLSRGTISLDIPKDNIDINRWLLDIIKTNKLEVYDNMLIEEYNKQYNLDQDKDNINNIFADII